MEKPATKEITNIESMQNGFHQSWKKLIGKDDVDPARLETLKKCPKISITTDQWFTKELLRNQFAKWNIEVTWQYDWPWLFFTLTETQKSFLNDHGRLVFNPGENWNTRTADNHELMQEERWLYYQKIGGLPQDYQRFSYNTVFVTTDMMLHFYHKIFSNALRFYEESNARTIMADLSKDMFSKFSKLYQQNKNTALAPYYAYATAYRAIPYTLLIPQDEVISSIDEKMQKGTSDEMDLTDKEIKALSLQRLASIQSQIPADYQAAVKTTIQNIFAADQARAEDALLTVLAWANTGAMDIQQDYTQFTPRSHYTKSSLLKTYFMWMKWLMREKLYFRDDKQTKASLVMIHNIQDKDLANFSQLYDFIQKLIGEDDDVNIKDIQSFIHTAWWTSDKNIIDGVSEDIQSQLKQLRPQRIISTHYKTPDVQMVTEQEAKDETAGFVFFWEKFTIDSWIFDRMTAGTAEKESSYKPNVQTSLIVPDGLINTGYIQELVDIRMQKAQSKYAVTAAQVDWYSQAKQEAQSGIFNQDFSISTYHQWLNDLWWLFALSGANQPYFMQDPLWKYKELNTFQGNYTELKHDTLLYVKQAYAEMWMWWPDECNITVTPPALPVPKWYIEPNVDLIDALLSLTEQTKQFFGENESFMEFSKFLTFAKDIAIKETKNEKISDDDYETLRLYYDKLLNILYPQKVINDSDNDFVSALIADIFTSEKDGPLYIANGRPYLLITTIKDTNGTRAVVWPIYSTFEFYGSDNAIAGEKWRYTDEDRRAWLDTAKQDKIITLPLQKILQK